MRISNQLAIVILAGKGCRRAIHIVLIASSSGCLVNLLVRCRDICGGMSCYVTNDLALAVFESAHVVLALGGAGPTAIEVLHHVD